MAIKRVFIIIIASASILALSHGICYSEVTPMSADIGVSLGYLFLDDDVDDDDKFSGRLDVGINVTERLGAEFSLMQTLDSFGDVPDVTFYTLSLAINFLPESTINPYILVGGGAGNFDTDVRDDDDVVVTAGAGVKYFFHDKYAVKIDVRDYMTTDDVTHNYSVTIGLMASFDLFPPQAVAPVREEEASEEPFSFEWEEDQHAIPEEKPETFPDAIYTKPETPEDQGLDDNEIKTAPKAPEQAGVVPLAIKSDPQVTVTMDETGRERMVAQETEPELSSAEPEKPAYDVMAKREITVTPEPETQVEVVSAGDEAGPEVIIAPSITDMDAPAYNIDMLHKGVQLLISFPYRSHELSSEAYNQLIELLSYVRDREITNMGIVCYSFDYDQLFINRKLSTNRGFILKKFVLNHSEIPEEKILVMQENPKDLDLFRKQAMVKGGYRNRGYILISYK